MDDIQIAGVEALELEKVPLGLKGALSTPKI